MARHIRAPLARSFGDAMPRKPGKKGRLASRFFVFIGVIARCAAAIALSSPRREAGMLMKKCWLSQNRRPGQLIEIRDA
jgi:hypothetical protein